MGMDGRMKPQADQQGYDNQSASPPLFAVEALFKPVAASQYSKLTLLLNALVITGRRRKLRAQALGSSSEGRSGR
jgi:hypothetical protein